MKTSVGRFFAIIALLLLAVLLVVGISFQLLVKNFLTDWTIDRLKTDGRAIAQLVQAYATDPTMSFRNYSVALSTATSVSDADAVICNAQGQLLYCAHQPYGCEHTGMVLNRDYLHRTFSEDGCVDMGTMDGLYPDARFVVSVPIRNISGGPLGVVIVSRPVSSGLAIMSSIFKIFLFLSLGASIVCVIAMIFFARRQSAPLRDLAKTARAFGHGDLTARAQLPGRQTAEVEDLALAFNNMASSLQNSEYRRQEFVANVSHELKTPMTAISGYVDGILDGTIPEEKQRQYLTLVSDETKRLSRLVRSMLDISRLQNQGELPSDQLSRFDLTELAGQVLISFEQKILEKKLDVQVTLPEHPVYTQAIQDQITQVLYNLLDNAIKFCDEGGILGLTVQEAGHKAYVSITNTGPNIPPEELPLLFDRFHKLDKSRSQNRDSWGLGLYIVKTIMDYHKENISVTSQDGTTSFTFTLPQVL